MKYILSFFGVLLLASCSFSQKTGKEEFDNIMAKAEVQSMLENAETEVFQPLPKVVSLSLEQKENHIEIYLLNPKKQFIRSTRNWLAFPAQSLTIKNLNLNTQVFNLAAPQEFVVDKDNGLIKIGLSATAGTVDEKILVGSFDFIKNKEESIPLSCYDYSEDTDSHCTVLGDEHKNILKEPSAILL